MQNPTLEETEAGRAARALWDSFTESEKHGVRFGLFPHEKVHSPEYGHLELTDLTQALYQCAEQDGGMIG